MDIATRLRLFGWRPQVRFADGLPRDGRVVSRESRVVADRARPRLRAGTHRDRGLTDDQRSPRHRARRRQRNAPVADDQRGQQAASADLRQADDLLSDLGADAVGYSRDPGDLDAARPAAVSRSSRRRLGVRRRFLAMRSRRLQMGLRRRSSSARISSRAPLRARARRQCLFRPGFRRLPRPCLPARARRHGLQLSGARSVALRRGRIRGRRACAYDRGKAGKAALQPGGDRALFL